MPYFTTDESPVANIMAQHDPKKLTDKEFNNFRKLIYRETGISLSEHKRALVMSRLAKRLRLHGLPSYKDYYDFIVSSGNEDELREMTNAITTNKTSFFREDYHFKFLETNLFPKLVQKGINGAARNLRIWSAGCSTGEEPYTIAMTAHNYFENHSNWKIDITATDIDTNVLERSNNGVYPLELADQIPDKLLNKYFMRGIDENAGYFRASNNLRSLIHFQQLNLNHPSWDIKGKFNIIFCRNVIIYFDRPTQKKLISRFIQHLEPNGLLMLGHSESLHGHDLDLLNLGKNIYQLAE
ncbi:MAG: protein-glutamate O-methyltransferase CheR [Proteobacteria bacterium]|nr:protein-glutamate O-methyltransferase CheR [Pseudomonadota bacterium]